MYSKRLISMHVGVVIFFKIPFFCWNILLNLCNLHSWKKFLSFFIVFFFNASFVYYWYHNICLNLKYLRTFYRNVHMKYNKKKCNECFNKKKQLYEGFSKKYYSIFKENKFLFQDNSFYLKYSCSFFGTKIFLFWQVMVDKWQIGLRIRIKKYCFCNCIRSCRT